MCAFQKSLPPGAESFELRKSLKGFVTPALKVRKAPGTKIFLFEKTLSESLFFPQTKNMYPYSSLRSTERSKFVSKTIL